MNLSTRVGSAAIALGMLAGTLLVMASCSTKNPAAVDPSFTTPEGTFSNQTLLIVWPETPVVGKVYRDNPPVGANSDDEFLGFESHQLYPDGTINGMVLDGSPSTSFQILRREPNGGLLPLGDFALDPARRWLDQHWDAFQFQDERPRTSFPEYVGRGLLAGSATALSPVSNVATSKGAAIADLPLHFPTDTTATWSPVAHAAYYISNIFQLRQAADTDKLRAAQHLPIYIGKSFDQFVGLSTQPTILGHAQPFVGTRLTDVTYVPGTYLVRVAAIDSLGQLIASSAGDSAELIGDETYFRYPVGGYTLPRPIIFHGPLRSVVSQARAPRPRH